MRVTVCALLFLTLLAGHQAAWAVESLRFKADADDRIIQSTALADFGAQNLRFAIIDLNKDGRDERIYKTRDGFCKPDTGCTHYILAKKDKDWIQIGEFNGFNLLISDKTTFGVRNILVYNVPHNDFANVTYVWNPKEYTYEPRS